MYINVDEEILQLAREPTELNYGEIILLALIINLSKDRNQFYMSNEAIAEIMCTSIRTIKRWLAHLREMELIEIYWENIGGRERRVMVPNLTQ